VARGERGMINDPARSDEAERIAAAARHVQISDWPGRGHPGSGSLDIWGILERLDARGYTGAVGLEYEPHGSTEASLAFLREDRAAALL
jgi:hydroxypyruvate isomerase